MEMGRRKSGGEEEGGTLFILKSVHLGYTDISPRGPLRKDNNYRPGCAYLKSRERRRSNESAERASRRREDGGDEKGALGAWREKPGSRRQHLPGRGPSQTYEVATRESIETSRFLLSLIISRFFVLTVSIFTNQIFVFNNTLYF